MGAIDFNPEYVVSNAPIPEYQHGEYEYRHMDRLVDMIHGIEGDPINTTTTGSFIDRTYTYNLPEFYNDVIVDLDEIKVVAYISETNQDIINGNGADAVLVQYSNDIGVSSINPTEIISPTSNEPITISITNYGENIISNFDVSYQLNDGSIVTETYFGQ